MEACFSRIIFGLVFGIWIQEKSFSHKETLRHSESVAAPNNSDQTAT